MEPEFVTGEAAVLLGEKLIVSDLHIGIEHEYYKSGIKMESQTHVMKTRLDSIIKISKPKELIFLGDIKHKVPGISYQEVKEIPEFINHFSKEIKVTVVMGNHDPGIENLGIKFHVKPTEGYASDDVYLTHGHTWPDKGFLGCRYIVM
ncbi:MAG: metallophosphoesterase, partial [Nanoarchaeota archaeon]|nr:metallophosphoesterase [Nanoarchaeota archaeon]